MVECLASEERPEEGIIFVSKGYLKWLYALTVERKQLLVIVVHFQ